MEIHLPERLRVDESKIVDYLLSQSNGRGKAAFFLGFEFRIETWQTLAEALKAHALENPISAKFDSVYGTRYSIDGELQTPSGRTPRIRSVWIHENGSDELRLITAHPI